MNVPRIGVLLCVAVLGGGLAGCGGDAAPQLAPVRTADAAQASARPDPMRAQASPDGVFVQAPAQPVAPARPDVSTLQQIAIPDPGGFDRPLTAMTLEIPAGWQGQGGMRWDRNVECIGNMYGMAWSATSPDGAHAVSLLPKLTWQVSGKAIEMNPCPAAPMTSARAHLEALVSSARPGARVLSYRDRPDMVAERDGATPQPVPGQRMWYEAGEILIGYPLQGQEMRETIVTAVLFSEMRDPMVGISLTGSAEDAYALRAPDGALDFTLLDRIRRSARVDEAWGKQVIAFGQRFVADYSQRQQQQIQSWHQRRMSEISWNGILERGRIRMDAIQTVGRINNASVAGRDASTQAIHAGNLDAIQEVQPWRDPSTGQQVDLSIHYQHAWQLDDGRQFLTNDSNFDPARDLGIEGKRLQPVR